MQAPDCYDRSGLYLCGHYAKLRHSVCSPHRQNLDNSSRTCYNFNQMKKLKVLKTDKEYHRKEAQEILDEAKDSRFDAVLVVGINSDGAHINHSGNVDTLKVVGMIEVAKLELWKNWDN